MLVPGNVKTDEEALNYRHSTRNLRAWFEEVPDYDGYGQTDLVAVTKLLLSHQTTHTANDEKSLPSKKM